MENGSANESSEEREIIREERLSFWKHWKGKKGEGRVEGWREGWKSEEILLVQRQTGPISAMVWW